MKHFAEEFRNLSSFYAKLAEDLNQFLSEDNSREIRTAVEFTLLHRQKLDQLSGMNSKIDALSSDWKLCRSRLDSATRDEADAMAAEAEHQAARLLELCRIHTQKIHVIHDEIMDSRSELAKGARFAKMLKPAKHNYPKFVDSSY